MAKLIFSVMFKNSKVQEHTIQQKRISTLTLLTEAGLWNSNTQIMLNNILLLKPNVQRWLKSTATAAAQAFGSYS